MHSPRARAARTPCTASRFGDGAEAAPLAGPRDQGFEVRVVEGPHDDAQAEARQPVRGGQELPVAEVAGQEEDAAARGPWPARCTPSRGRAPGRAGAPSGPKKSRQHSMAVMPRCSKHWRASVARAAGDRVSPYTSVRLSSATRRRPGKIQYATRPRPAPSPCAIPSGRRPDEPADQADQRRDQHAGRRGARARRVAGAVPRAYLSQPRSAELTPAMSAAAGIVRIHAQTIRPAMPQRTAELPVEGRDERRVDLPDEVVRQDVAGVLELLDGHGLRRRVREVEDHLAEPSRRRDDVPPLLLEEVEEALLARDQPEHGRYRGRATASPRRARARHHSTPIGITESTMTTPITMWM